MFIFAPQTKMEPKDATLAGSSLTRWDVPVKGASGEVGFPSYFSSSAVKSEVIFMTNASFAMMLLTLL